MSKDNRRYLRRQLMIAIGAVLIIPNRLTPLTMQEEYERCISSWKSWDTILWLACNDMEYLVENIVRPKDFHYKLEGMLCHNIVFVALPEKYTMGWAWGGHANYLFY